jgi:hypothetical protein
MKKKIILIAVCTWTLPTLCDFQAYTAAQSQLSQARQRSKNSPTPSDSILTGSTPGNNCTPTTCTDEQTSTALPSFQIDLYDSLNYNLTSGSKTLNSFTFTTGSNFTVNNALLCVDIFPPSGSISGTTFTPLTGDAYAIIYTLRTLSGSILQRAVQYTPAASASATNPSTVFSTIPIYIEISSVPVTSNSTLTNNQFLPAINTHQLGTQQRILNNIAPISQQFLITNTGSGTTQAATAAAISSMLNATSSSTLQIPFNQSAAATANGGLNTITVTLNSSTTFTFGSTTSMFSAADLQNGLLLYLYIYPPATSGGTNSTYNVIATLQTLDGFKFHKNVSNIGSSGLSSVPSTLSITSGALTFNTYLCNSDTVSQNANIINAQTPYIVRCIIQTNAISML